MWASLHDCDSGDPPARSCLFISNNLTCMYAAHCVCCCTDNASVSHDPEGVECHFALASAAVLISGFAFLDCAAVDHCLSTLRVVVESAS